MYHPETWFHYIGGNVSFDGITADLEAIAGAGLSGIQLFHGQFGGPWPNTTEQIPCLSPRWDAAVKHTAEECKRLGLRFTMQNCPGWAMSGGPWIQPENAMRHLAWSRTDVQSDGKNPVQVTLPKPQPSNEDWRDYREITVIAFPTPLENSLSPLKPDEFKSDLPDLPWADCFAGNANGKITLPPTDRNHPHWIEVSFPNEVTLRTIEFPSINSYNHAFCYEPGITVTVEKVFANDPPLMPITRVDFPQASWQDDRPISFACSETRGNRFRISIINQHDMLLNSIKLFSAARVNNWESEAGWTLRGMVRTGNYPSQSAQAFIDVNAVQLLADKMDANGNFSATLPEGPWTLLRVGHINTGAKNGPAPPEGTGWECNKLSQTGADIHFAGYIGRLIEKGGPLEGLLGGVLFDSWECKTQTWTEGLDKIFEKQLGYSPLVYLPAVFGYVVQDHETSRRFLLDWRRTIGDLFANEFYGRMAELADQHHLTIQYETAAGDIFPADILEYYKHADVPMCEFWQPFNKGYVGSLNFKPIKPTASAARLYGKTRVSAESFTSFYLTWDEQWEMLKEVFNRNAVEGVTHVIFHTCTHQPQTGDRFLPPGTSMGSGIGTPFLRGQTWWSSLPAFTDFLARCTFLLERGRPVSDVLWYLGDEISHKPDQECSFPNGFKYDYCNPDILLNRLSVQNGELVTPEGLRYKVLWMPDTRRMLPNTVEKLLELVRAGATIIGDRPEWQLATLSPNDNAKARFETACRELWGDDPGTGIRSVGQGQVISGMLLENAIQKLGFSPDLLANDQAGNRIDNVQDLPGWVHRQIDGADWYFVTAPVGKGFNGTVSFRTNSPTGEIWNPVNGNTSPVTVQTKDGRATISLDLPPAGSCFVVFPKEQLAQGNPIDQYQTVERRPLTESWTLTFPEGWGIDKPVQTNELTAWKNLPLSDEGKAFSGTVHYETCFTLQEDDLNAARLTLDLGKVTMIAAVRLNGQPLGVVWATPYQLDITSAAQSGENKLEIDVTGTWFNRLVYDAGRPEAERKTWTISGPAPNAELRDSGLLGPVVLNVEQEK